MNLGGLVPVDRFEIPCSFTTSTPHHSRAGCQRCLTTTASPKMTARPCSGNYWTESASSSAGSEKSVQKEAENFFPRVVLGSASTHRSNISREWGCVEASATALPTRRCTIGSAVYSGRPNCGDFKSARNKSHSDSFSIIMGASFIGPTTSEVIRSNSHAAWL
jgi:hypothetical protein